MAVKDSMEYNIYSAFNFDYDFSLGDAYLTSTGFSNTEEDIYKYNTAFNLSAISINMFSSNIQDPSSFSILCLDSTNNIIPGTQYAISSSPLLGIGYRFNYPVLSGSNIRFKVVSTEQGLINFISTGVVIKLL